MDASKVTVELVESYAKAAESIAGNVPEANASARRRAAAGAHDGRTPPGGRSTSRACERDTKSEHTPLTSFRCCFRRRIASFSALNAASRAWPKEERACQGGRTLSSSSILLLMRVASASSMGRTGWRSLRGPARAMAEDAGKERGRGDGAWRS